MIYRKGDEQMQRHIEAPFIAVVMSAAIIPFAGQAQEASGAVTLGYGASNISDGGGDLSSLTLDAGGNISLTENVNLGLHGSFVNANPDGAGDINFGDLGAKLVYQFENGFLIGGYIDHATLDLGNVLGDIDATSYGGTAGYVSGSFGAEVFVGATETSPDLPSGTDWMDYGAVLRYKLSPKSRIGGHVMRSDISGGGADIEIDSFGIGGDVAFGAGWGAFGGLSHAKVDLINTDVTSLGIGVSYELSQVSAIPGAISLEVARSHLDNPVGDANADTIRFGLTFPLGGQENTTPFNSVDRSVIAPRHNTVTTLLNTAF